MKRIISDASGSVMLEYIFMYLGFFGLLGVMNASFRFFDLFNLAGGQLLNAFSNDFQRISMMISLPFP